MRKLTGRAVFRIFQRAINLLEPNLSDHGSRVAYILRCMLECEGISSKEELDRFMFIGLLHDIGAYKTDEIDRMLTFDCQRVWKHSVYGYLYLRYLSPLQENAAVVLYHHLDYNRFDQVECDLDLKRVSMYLNIADRVDILLCQRYKRLRHNELAEGRDTRFSGAGLELFYQAEKRFGILNNLNSDGYQKQLDLWAKEMTLDEAECREYLKLLSYIVDFKSERTVLRTVITSVVGRQIAELLSFTAAEKELFHYAVLIYDVGMLGIPAGITDAPRALSEAERRRVQTHVQLMSDVMGSDMDWEVVQVARGHHEKLDGSGYPNRLRSGQINKLQRTLAVADILSALSCGNNRRMAYAREDVVRTVLNEAFVGKLDMEIVHLVTDHLDEIMERAVPDSNKILTNYRAIKEESDEILARFDRFD